MEVGYPYTTDMSGTARNVHRSVVSKFGRGLFHLVAWPHHARPRLTRPMEIDSMPVELDEVEREALRKETDAPSKERLSGSRRIWPIEVASVLSLLSQLPGLRSS